MLAITNGDRLTAGLLAVLGCLLALIVWLFPILALGRLWRHMTRGPRTRCMRLMIAAMFLFSAGLLIGVPHTSYDIEMLTLDDMIDIQNDSIGVTSWYTHRIEDRTFVPPMSQGTPIVPAIFETNEISLVGIFAILPALAAMLALAIWLGRNMPGFYRRPEDRCDECDYDLHGHHSPVCPECGEVVK